MNDVWYSGKTEDTRRFSHMNSVSDFYFRVALQSRSRYMSKISPESRIRVGAWILCLGNDEEVDEY